MMGHIEQAGGAELVSLLGQLSANAPGLGQTIFAFDDGRVFSIGPHIQDGTAQRIERVPDDAALKIFTNPMTLRDLLLGRLDPAAPTKDQLFLWEGDAAALLALGRAIQGGLDVVALRGGPGE